MLYTGVIEDRSDPLKLGRCKVRIIGLHTHDVVRLPTADLPWAIPMQPITSAALSGIGTTPLGLVEGTTVVIVFQDEDKQFPIILGSIGGIPQSSSEDISVDDSTLKIKIDGELKQTNNQSNVLLDGSGNAVLDGSGNPVTTAPTETILQNTNKLKRAIEFKASADCVNLIKRFEGLHLTSYLDPVGIWTVGYGTTFINNSKVQPGITITKEQAETFLSDHINKEFAPGIQRNTRALITQSMFDAICSVAYNMGVSGFLSTTIFKDLNSSKYLDSAADFKDYTKAGRGEKRVELPGLVLRRAAEKDLFLKDGIPNVAGELLEKEKSQTDSQIANNISADSNTVATTSSTIGFADPNRKYPLYFDEPDTNRLARHEEINKTIVYKKEAAQLKNVAVADGSTWNQPSIPYNAQYPFNHVMQTESGHVLEFDDTPYSERIHLYHKSGTFTEIDSNGTQVNRIIGDGYEILERNGYVQINGSLNVTVDGAQNILVKNAMNISVNGVATINVYNNANLNISGNMNLSVGETLAIKAASIKMEADLINVKSSGNINIDAAGEASVKASGNAKLDGAQVHLGMGANSAEASGVADPKAIESTTMPDFGNLTIISRGASGGQYETLDEGDSTAYTQKQIITGAIKQEEIDSGVKTETQVAPPAIVAPGTMMCDAIMMKTSFEPSFVMSKNFTIGAFNKNGSRPIISQFGLKEQEIVCNLKGLAENCLEPIRNLYPNMILTSVFRRPGDVANSSKTSDHYLGCAADIVIPNADRKGHYEAIQKIQQLIPYDQLLLEYMGATTVWIHVSFKYATCKKQIFTMRDHRKIGDFGQFVLVA